MWTRNRFAFPKERRLILAGTLPIALFLLVLLVFKSQADTSIFQFLQQSDEWTLSKDALRALKEGAMRIKGRKVVIATAVTVHYAPFLENLRCWMRRMEAGEVVVFGLDDGMVSYGRSHGFLTVDFAKQEETSDRRFGRKGFNILTKRKLDVAYAVLRQGFDLVFTDVDVVWCGDVVRDLVHKMEGRIGLGRGERDMVLVQNDARNDNEQHVSMNSGFYYARSGKGVIDLWGKMCEYREKQNKINDQDVFNRVGCKIGWGGRVLERSEHGRGVTVCEWKGRVELEALTLQEYVNGGAWVGDKVRKKLFEMPKGVVGEMCRKGDFKIVHNNWCRGESEKLRRFEQANLWAWDEDAGICVFP